MNNFERAHNSYLEPPEEPPVCEDGCSDTLERDPWTHEWVCPNKFCPTKFSGLEKEMAEALVEFMDETRTLKARLQVAKSTLGEYVHKFGPLWKHKTLK